MVVKALLIATVASFNFTIVPRSAQTDQFMFYPILSAEFVKNMYSFSSAEIGEFRAIIRLNHFRSVSKIGDRSLNKIHC